MRILVANDDGAFNPALWALVRAIKDLGEIVVCSPDRDRSGVGAGLTLNDPVRAKAIHSPVEGVTAYAIEGTPGDAVILGMRKLSPGPVDLVLSGINNGNNIGSDVIVSGTVGAGLQGYLNGVPSAAVSVAVSQDAESPAVAIAVRTLTEALLEMAAASAPPVFVNMNIPRLSDGPLQGARKTTVAPRLVADAIETVSRGERTIYWIQRRAAVRARPADMTPDTDVWAMHHSYVSMTPISYDLMVDQEAPGIDRMVELVDGAVRGQPVATE